MTTHGPDCGTRDGQESDALLDRLLVGHEAHIWYTDPALVAEASLVAAYRELLSPAERERNARFLFERGRHADLVTRVLVRTTLSRYWPGIAPTDWQFVVGPHGKPEVVRPRGCPELRFNLSHTDGSIVCLVAAGHDVGVDVEDTTRTGTVDVETIAERYFSARELAAIRGAPPSSRRSTFFDCWTLKEAYVKARGLGLQLPLDRFAVQVGPHDDAAIRRATIAFDAEIADDPRAWQFLVCSPTPRHRLAIAIYRPGEPDLTVRVWSTVPLSPDPDGGG
ncbi:MAG: 4'-phosphopantetheinyl transferase superfamily protein [Chloroflexota bacterium]